MGLVLNKVYDPRDNLQRIRRKPLENFIKQNFPKEYRHNMPADLLRQMLRERGIYDINLPKQQMGQHDVRIDPNAPASPVSGEAEKTVEVDAMAALRHDFERQAKPAMSMPQLRKAVKAKGIKAPITSKREDLERMLNAEDAA